MIPPIVSLVSVALIAAAALFTSAAGAQRPTGACCSITAVDAKTGVISAKVTASGDVFEFKARNPSTIASLRVGQAVHANFANNQVSLDGRSACCTITKAPARAVAVRQPPGGAPKTALDAAGATKVAVKVYPLPSVTYGEPVPVTPQTRRGAKLAPNVASYDVSAKVGGRTVRSKVLHINGPDGIRRATVIPEGAQRLLEMHRRKLPLGASQYYLVDAQRAIEWIRTHPVPPEIKPKDEDKEDESECGKISINGIRDCGQDAVDAVEDEFARLQKRAEEWWDESAETLGDLWNETRACFADHTLPGPQTPVKFSITPSMSVNMQQSATKGPAKGTVSGNVRLGVPLQADFDARMEFFYIPCLPFAVRPKSLTGDGSITVGQQLSVDLTATGAFFKRYTIPPTGGPMIPLYVIPIVIGNVPVAELDISAYIEGEVDIEGDGKVTGQFSVSNSHRSTFDFKCDGSGCGGTDRGSTSPTTTNQHAQIQGQVSVRPGLYTALQLNFDYNVLSARVGPQPYFIGLADGCSAVSASQTSGGTSSTQLNSALTADLDWAVKIRAEALAGGKVIGKRWETKARDPDHVWFRDLAPGGSSALVPSVTGAGQAAVAQPSAIKVRMPSCYPYTSDVRYRLTWDGGAIPAPNAACQWQAGGGTCKVDPHKDLALGLTWQNAGAYSLSVQLLRDEHRTFSPAPPPARFSITVGAATGGGSP